MAGVSKSAANSKVTDRVDPKTSMIPVGEEHQRCREALAGADVNNRDAEDNTH